MPPVAPHAECVTVPVRDIVCERCGTRFGCGTNGGAAFCWCANEPASLTVPLPGAADCLCPDCLRAATRPDGAKP
jgi:hypothetical protein